jgi:hypothetical protein
MGKRHYHAGHEKYEQRAFVQEGIAHGFGLNCVASLPEEETLQGLASSGNSVRSSCIVSGKSPGRSPGAP